MSSSLRGIRIAVRSRDVKGAYLWTAVALSFCVLLLQGAGVGLSFYLIPVAKDAHIAIVVGTWLLRISAIIIVLLLAPILAITLCKIAAPIFSEIPFLAGMRAINRRLAKELKEQSGLPLALAIGLSLRRMMIFLCLLGVCFSISLIPVVGALIAGPLQLYLASRTMGWEMLDPYFDKRGYRLKSQRNIVRAYLPEVLGMGLVSALLLAIPFVGPLLFGILQASVAQFVVDHLEPKDAGTTSLSESHLESLV